MRAARVILHCSIVLVYLTLTAVGWQLMPNGIWGVYSLTDGALAAWNSYSIFGWSQPFDASPYNFLQGLGSLYIPNTPWLNPGALAMSMPGGIHVRYYLSYSIYFLEAFLSIVVLARTFGFSTLQAILAAQTFCLVAFPPYTNYFVTLPWISLAPFNAHLTAVFNVALALFKRLGEASHRQSLCLAILIVLLAVSAFFSSEVSALTYLPAYGSVAVLTMVYKPTRRSAGWKIGVIVGLSLAALLLGLPQFYAGTVGVTSGHLLTPATDPAGVSTAIGMLLDSLKSYDWCAHPQVFLCGEYPIGYFHAAALVGAAVLVVLGTGLQRLLGGWTIVFIAFLHLYAAAGKLQLLGVMNRISVDFLHFSAYTFYATCVIAGIFVLTATVGSAIARSGKSKPPLAGVAYVVVSFAVVAYATWILGGLRPAYRDLSTMRHLLEPRIYAPIQNPITAKLIEVASVSPGGSFRGHTATYFGGRDGPLREKLGFGRDTPSSTEIYVDSRHYLRARYGNSFMMTDLWQHNIPTFEEYGQWVTKTLYIFASAVFARPGDTMQSSEISVHSIDLKAMQALGIRFVITDADLRDQRLRLLASYQADPESPPYWPAVAGFAKQGQALLAGRAIELRLYEIQDANIASFSPIRITRAFTVQGFLDRFQSPDFSPVAEVIVFEDLSGKLVSATESRLEIHAGYLRVTGRSTGVSLLLLPIQYSRCFSIRSLLEQPQRAAVRLLRANLIQTALLFDQQLDAVLSFDFGPGNNVRCRLQDAMDMEQLDLSAWRPPAKVSRSGLLPAR